MWIKCEKRFLDLSLYPNLHKKLMESILTWSLLNSFCIILLMNKQTGWRHDLLCRCKKQFIMTITVSCSSRVPFMVLNSQRIISTTNTWSSRLSTTPRTFQAVVTVALSDNTRKSPQKKHSFLSSHYPTSASRTITSGVLLCLCGEMGRSLLNDCHVIGYKYNPDSKKKSGSCAVMTRQYIQCFTISSYLVFLDHSNR